MLRCTVKGCRKKAVAFGKIFGRRARLCKEHGVMLGVLRDDIRIIVHGKDEENPLGRIEVVKVKKIKLLSKAVAELQKQIEELKTKA